MRAHMKRIICLIIVAMFTMSISAFAQTGNDGERKLTFPDTIRHWSQKHVAKLAALDIVKGQSNGNYGVDDTVSQQEVIVMAVRLMGKEEEAVRTSGDTGTALDTDTWARPHVVYALREGILRASEEMKDSGHQNWGTRSAKREWVAKIMVRALGKEEDAEKLGGKKSGFNDHEDITGDFIGYVNAAVEMGIITGTTTNDFLPLKTITRSETASIFAKALSFIPQSDAVTVGRVSSITSTTLTVRDADGDLQTLGLNRNTAYFHIDENYQVLKDSVKEGVEVYVVHNDRDALYVEVTDEAEPLDVISGVVENIEISNNNLTITNEKGRTVEYLMADGVAVIDADGKGTSLSQVMPLSEVELKINPDNYLIVEIQIMDEPISTVGEGIVVSISDERLIVRDKDNGEEKTYPVSSLLSITYEDEKIDLEDVKSQDVISFTVDYGFVTEIEILQPYIEPEKGKVVNIDYTNRYIVIDNGGVNPVAYYYADDVRVELEGMSAPTLDDVMPQDEVTISFNDEGKISVITIKNRSLASSQMLTFIAYLEAENQIIVLDHDKNAKSFKLTNDTVFELNGEEYPVKELNDRLKSSSTRVDLSLTGEYVRRITVSEGYTGIVEEINTSSGVLKISNPTIGKLEFKLTSSTRVERLDDSSARLSQVKVGDDVQVILNDNQDAVSRIRLKHNVYHVITDIRESNGRVTMKDLDNNTERIYVTDTFKLTHPSERYVYFDDLAEDMPVTVSYYGRREQSINLLETIYGVITELNFSNDTMVIETPDGKKQEFNTAKNFTMLKGRISQFSEGDRISILRDIDGYSFAERVTKQVKDFYRLESGNRISFTNPLGEVERFDLAKDVLVRANDRTIDLEDLKRNDRLTVYIVNGAIVEIEVQK